MSDSLKDYSFLCRLTKSEDTGGKEGPREWTTRTKGVGGAPRGRGGGFRFLGPDRRTRRGPKLLQGTRWHKGQGADRAPVGPEGIEV